MSAETPTARQPAVTARRQPIAVFVHLARDKDLSAWRRARDAGTLVGVNDATPYGYGRADHMGCTVTFSRSSPETVIQKFVRLAFRVVLGFDYIHARQQGAALTGADIVWTHTESQYLAAAALLRDTSRPLLLGQSVWLFDRWRRLGPLRRWFYRRLIARVTILTVLSPLNLCIAQTLFPEKVTRLVPFGVPTEVVRPPRVRLQSPTRIVAVGNDRHRDWTTLIAAVEGCGDLALVILSGQAKPSLARGLANVTIRPARTADDLAAELDAATMACVPLKANLHASGITALQEAVLAGLPVVATDTGGLDSYFTPDLVRYVPPGDPVALREAFRALAAKPEEARAMAERAQRRIAAGDLGAEAYVRQHVTITEELLSS